jgi:hypothetical protein
VTNLANSVAVSLPALGSDISSKAIKISDEE